MQCEHIAYRISHIDYFERILSSFICEIVLYMRFFFSVDSFLPFSLFVFGTILFEFILPQSVALVSKDYIQFEHSANRTYSDVMIAKIVYRLKNQMKVHEQFSNRQVKIFKLRQLYRWRSHSSPSRIHRFISTFVMVAFH